MNYLTLSTSLILVIFSIGPSEAGLKCHYCGIKDLCPLPYDTIDANFITCPNSCLKFDGLADGKRVIIRDCATEEVDQCSEEPQKYANTRAEGTLCTCMSDKCNGSTQLMFSGLLLPAVLLITKLY